MKKQLIIVLLAGLTISANAQRKELKEISKDLETKQFTTAMAKVESLEKTILSAKDKYKSKFYFLKAKTLKGLKKYVEAGKVVTVLLDFEKKNKSTKYTSDASFMVQEMSISVSKEALDLYNVKKDYKAASEKFYLTYQLSPKDTTFMFNAAVSSEQAKDNDKALLYYKKLQKLNYSGVEVLYYLTDNKTGKQVNAGSKKQRDLLVKTSDYSKPKDETTTSKKGEIAKRIALILKNQGKTDEAIKAITDARKANPKDESLIFAAAEIYHKLNKMDKFGALMKEAIALRPNDPELFYNLGVVNANGGQIEEAVKYYKKAISLKPSYYDANINCAAVLLAKDKVITENINKAITANNDSNYKKYVSEQKENFKRVLPFLAKADELKRSLETVKTLKNIYESLEMKEKSQEFVKLYKQMK